MSFFVEISASAEKVSDSINQIMETKAEKAYNPFLMLLRKKSKIQIFFSKERRILRNNGEYNK